MLQAAMKHTPRTAVAPQVDAAKGPWAQAWALQDMPSIVGLGQF